MQRDTTIAADTEPAIHAPLSAEDFAHRVGYLSRAQVLEISLRLAARVPGHVVEFGVADGSSTRTIQRLLRWHPRIRMAPHWRKQVYALDSFEGLREAFENAPVGSFAGPVPRLPGVVIVKGYFEETCTEELRQRIGRVAFAHLDADLYSSTLCALRWLTPMLDTGSILQFDEFIGGDNAEARALEEWHQETGTRLVRVAAFDREPSGWGSSPDRRAVFQVIGDGKLPPAFSRGATRLLALRRFAGRVRRRLVLAAEASDARSTTSGATRQRRTNT